MTEPIPQSEIPNPQSRRVCLVGWDAADWKMINPLLETGQMPALQKLIENGVMGNVASLSPMLSPILWTSIATGKHADKHNILGFAEPDGDSGKLRPVTSTSRKCKALWNILSEHGKRAGVINWFASHPAEPINGFVVSDRYPQPVGPPDKEWPAVPGSVRPADLLDELAKLRVHPAATTPAQVAPFIPNLKDIDPEKDKKLHELRILLAHSATVQSAATYLAQAEEWDFFGIYFDAVDRFAHAFMEFHPPKMAHVAERDFELYQHVMTGIYRFSDMMLGRMMQLAGEDTTFIILSDHGFHCDHLRPTGSAEIKDGRPVSWHRQHGVLVISGPGIKKDERVYGASLLDITPTVLWLMGLPVAKDMDGHALTQIGEGELREAERIDTYEGVMEGAGGIADCGLRIADSKTEQPPDGEQSEIRNPKSEIEQDPWAAQATLQRLADLGYIEQDASVEGVVLDRARNLGQVYAATGRPKLAIDQYEQVLARKPDDKGTKMAIAECRLQLGELDACEKIVREVLGSPAGEPIADCGLGIADSKTAATPDAEQSEIRNPKSAISADAPHASLYLGMIEFRRGNVDSALKHLLSAERADARLPGLHVQIGNVYLRRRRWRDGERAFKKALAIDPDSAEAHDGLGVAYRWQKRPAEAVHEHMQSISLLHYRPQTHIHLGLALAETGQIDWAIRAFHVALEQNPGSAFAHHCLAQLYERAKQDPARALIHSERAKELRAAIGA